MTSKREAPKPNHHTPLHWAAKNGHTEAAHAMLEAILAQDRYVQLLTGASINHQAGPEKQVWLPACASAYPQSPL